MVIKAKVSIKSRQFEGGLKPNGLNPNELPDLTSGINKNLGQIFTSLNEMFVRPVPFSHFNDQLLARNKVDQIYEQIRLEVI